MTEQEIAMPMDNREFNQMVGMARMATGFSAELRVAADLYERGFSVAKPMDGSTKYDLIADNQGKLIRVQVKSSGAKYIQAFIGWTVYKENVYDGKGVTAHVVRKYNDVDFDVLAIYHRMTSTIYYVPVEDLDLSKPSFQVRQSERERYSGFPK